MTSFDAALYAFPAASACSAAAVNAAGAGHSSDLRSFSNEQIKITPSSSGDWIVAVDAATSSLYGSFTLAVTEDKGTPTFTPPFTWDFESDCHGLDATGDWECGKLSFAKGPNCSTNVVPPGAGHSGAGMWGTVLNDCYSPLDNALGSSSAGLQQHSPLG